MNTSYKSLPLSYRISQSGIAFALLSTVSLSSFFRAPVPLPFRIFLGVVLAGIIVTSLLTSYYVIIRYPFLSLVQTKDPDPFARHFSSADGRLYFFLKLLTMVCILVSLPLTVMKGLDTLPSILLFCDTLFVLGFLIFFTFWYQPIRHPTVSTFVRSTLGLGIPLFPLFLPAIWIGSLRCSKMLEHAAAEL